MAKSLMIFDRSIEAQFLIPMAVSMGFGILFTTVITLFLVPCVLMLSDDLAAAWRQWFQGAISNPGKASDASTRP